MKWELKENIKSQGKGEFWYDLTDGSYIKPEEILNDKEQLNKLNEAIKVIKSFEEVLRENELLNEY